jgi:hypothetical protein
MPLRAVPLSSMDPKPAAYTQPSPSLPLPLLRGSLLGGSLLELLVLLPVLRRRFIMLALEAEEAVSQSS